MLLEAGLQLFQSAGDYFRALSSHSVPFRDVQKVTDAKSDACAHTFARPESHGAMRAVNIDGKDVVHCLFLAKQEHMTHGAHPTFHLGPTIATTRRHILLWCDTVIRSPNHRSIGQCGDHRKTKPIATAITIKKENTSVAATQPRPHAVQDPTDKASRCLFKTFVCSVDTIQTHVHAIFGQTVHQHFTEEPKSTIVEPLDSTR